MGAKRIHHKKWGKKFKRHEVDAVWKLLNWRRSNFDVKHHYRNLG